MRMTKSSDRDHKGVFSSHSLPKATFGLGVDFSMVVLGNVWLTSGIVKFPAMRYRESIHLAPRTAHVRQCVHLIRWETRTGTNINTITPSPSARSINRH
jgi:hypothetical protein